MLIEAGDANTTPKNDVTNAINNPKGHNLNSAWQPYFIATNLCPSSCNTDPIATPTITIGKHEMNACAFKPAVAIEKQIVSAINAIIKSLISTLVYSTMILNIYFNK